MRKILVLLALAIAASCGDDGTSPPTPSFNGTWTGSTAQDGLAFDVSMTVSDQGGDISGSGVFTVGQAGGVAFTVSGTHAHPNVSLTITSSGNEDANYSGSFANVDQVTGTLNGSGFANTPLALTRQ